MRVNRKQEVAMWALGLVWCALLFFLTPGISEGSAAVGILAILTFLILFSFRDRP
jgi:hypothetical protein